MDFKEHPTVNGEAVAIHRLTKAPSSLSGNWQSGTTVIATWSAALWTHGGGGATVATDSTGEITAIHDGPLRLTINLGGINNQRLEITAWVEKWDGVDTWNEVAQTRFGGYVARDANQDEGSISGSPVVMASVGDHYRVRTKADADSVTSGWSANLCWIIVEAL